MDNLTGKKTNELFKWLFDNFNHESFLIWNDKGICEKIYTMCADNIIDYDQKKSMIKLLNDHKDIAINKYGAENSPYWWHEEDHNRKKFVKYLSELK